MGRWDANEYQGDQEVRMHYHMTAIKLSKIIKTFYRVFRSKTTQMSTEVLQVRCVCNVVSCFSRVCPCECMEVAQQAPLSKGFSRQENWSGLPCPSQGDLPNPGIKPGSPALQVDSSPTELSGKPWNGWISTIHPPGEDRIGDHCSEICCRKQIHVLVKALYYPRCGATGCAAETSVSPVCFFCEIALSWWFHILFFITYLFLDKSSFEFTDLLSSKSK